MRVIGGKYRSRRIQTLRGLALRPSSDRLRETLFNILGAAVDGSIFIDLFAGSGAVGIEALSRGARYAIFVENHAAGAALLRRNIESLGIGFAVAHAAFKNDEFGGTAEVLLDNAIPALEKLEGRGLMADFVFADPPYADSVAYDEVLDFFGESDLLPRDAILIIEHDRRRELPAIVESLQRFRTLEQGDTVLSFYRVVLAA